MHSAHKGYTKRRGGGENRQRDEPKNNRVVLRSAMTAHAQRFVTPFRATKMTAMLACGAALLVGGCQYARLLRPKVLKQVNPEVAQLVNELPEVDRPNKEIIARLFPHGGLAHAKRGDDGVFRASISVPDGQFIWKPAIIRMSEGGELELEFMNEDRISHHAVYLPNNGNPVTATFAPGEKARARIRLDSPGLYWFGCPVSNHAGRGMLGLVMVGGEVPAEAKIDRPAQPRPR